MSASIPQAERIASTRRRSIDAGSRPRSGARASSPHLVTPEVAHQSGQVRAVERQLERQPSADADAGSLALGPIRTPARWRFFVCPLTDVALHLRWSGRGITGTVVCDANDLAHAPAGTGVHGPMPVTDDCLRPGTAPLAQQFRNGRHQHPAPDPHVSLHRRTRGIRPPPREESVLVPGAISCKPVPSAAARNAPAPEILHLRR
jgi:hypothetical protein